MVAGHLKVRIAVICWISRLSVLLLKLITFIALSVYCYIFLLEVSVLSDELQITLLMLSTGLSSVVLKQSNKCVTEAC